MIERMELMHYAVFRVLYYVSRWVFLTNPSYVSIVAISSGVVLPSGQTFKRLQMTRKASAEGKKRVKGGVSEMISYSRPSFSIS